MANLERESKFRKAGKLMQNNDPTIEEYLEKNYYSKGESPPLAKKYRRYNKKSSKIKIRVIDILDNNTSYVFKTKRDCVNFLQKYYPETKLFCNSIDYSLKKHNLFRKRFKLELIRF